jgi:DNA/RNA-binding domain of Phe-tRNA-synthetase-like protein
MLAIAEPVRILRGLTLTITTVKGLSVQRSSAEFDLLEQRALEQLRKQYTLQSLKGDVTVSYYRELLWRLKLDPTKMRPSSEALLRRVLRGERLPRINNVVDAVNLASVQTLIPMGIYDLDKLSGALSLRFAKAGEEFIGIDGIREELSGAELVIADEQGPIHLYPCRDSERTKIGPETGHALLIVCGAPGVEIPTIRSATRKACGYLRRFAEGRSRSRVLMV